jgi:predicted alpha/beta hydrolase family esterase
MKEYKPLLVVVHGGDSSSKRLDDNVEYRELIQNQYGLKKGSPLWTETLDQYLSENFEVLAFEFPTSYNAIYSEWSRFLEQVLADFHPYRDEIVLVGHSLGTTFLQQYLVENNLQRNYNLKIQSLHLVGCCLKEGDFEINPQWSGLDDISNVHIYHSLDDPVCKYSDALEFKQNLGHASVHTFDHRGHFDQSQFPELQANILNLKKL